MGLAGRTQRVEVRRTGFVVTDELLGELAAGDLAEDLLHLGLGGVGDDARSAGEVAVFSSRGDGIPHAADALLVHQVDDELHFVEALEVGHLGLVPGLDESLEARLHERREATAQHDLLTEQVGLRLLGKGRLDHAGARTTDGVGIAEGLGLRRTRRVLVDSDESRDTAALGVRAPHEVAGALRGDHDHVDVGDGLHQFEADVETVGEGNGLTGGEVRCDVAIEDLGDVGVGERDHHKVSPLGCVAHAHDAQACGLGLGLGRRAVAQPDDDVDPGFLQVQRMGVALAAVAEDGHLGAEDDRGISIFFVVHDGHGRTP